MSKLGIHHDYLAGSLGLTNTHTAIDSHIANVTTNPHQVDKSDVGLGNVENTALSTWEGTSNITTIGVSAVTAHEGSITHDNLNGVHQGVDTDDNPIFASLYIDASVDHRIFDSSNDLIIRNNNEDENIILRVSVGGISKDITLLGTDASLVTKTVRPDTNLTYSLGTGSYYYSTAYLQTVYFVNTSNYISSNGTDIAFGSTTGKCNFTSVGGVTIDVDSATALVVEQNGVNDNVLVVDTASGCVGINKIKLSTLTSGRVTYAGTDGLLQDNANLTFDGTNLTCGGSIDASAGADHMRFNTTSNSRYIEFNDWTGSLATIESNHKIYIRPDNNTIGWFSSGFNFYAPYGLLFGQGGTGDGASLIKTDNAYQKNGSSEVIFCLKMGLGDTDWGAYGYKLARYLLVCDASDAASTYNFGHDSQNNPTIFIHSAAQSTTQWLGLTHDGTNGVLSVGTGTLSIPGTLGVTGLSTLTGGISLPAGADIALATSTGTKIGTATSQLLGFYNATPVDQPATVSDATTQDLTGTDSIDQTKLESDLSNIVTAINTVIDRLQELGLIA